MSTTARPAWSDDCFKPQPERHYKGKRPSRRLVEGNSARTTSVASIVTQEGVHSDEASDWLGLGRRRDPAPLPPPATRSLREALEPMGVSDRFLLNATRRASLRRIWQLWEKIASISELRYPALRRESVSSFKSLNKHVKGTGVLGAMGEPLYWKQSFLAAKARANLAPTKTLLLCKTPYLSRELN